MYKIQYKQSDLFFTPNRGRSWQAIYLTKTGKTYLKKGHAKLALKAIGHSRKTHCTKSDIKFDADDLEIIEVEAENGLTKKEKSVIHSALNYYSEEGFTEADKLLKKLKEQKWFER
jgi:hypothetical protein